MVPDNLRKPNRVNGGLEQLSEYKATVARLFPALPRHVIDNWSITDIDALALTRFLNRYPCEVVVLEIGTFVGVSAFHYASQPKVSKVVSVDLNLSLTELGKSGWGDSFSPDMRPLDVAKAAFSCFPEQQRKVRFVAGTAASLEQEVYANEEPLVAFVDGSHSKEAVEADLRAIFEKYPYAVAVLHDCVNIKHGPGVLMGVATFGGTSSRGYRLRLFKQLDTDPRHPNLGILYPEAVASQVERLAAGLLGDPTSALFGMSYLRWLLRNWVPPILQRLAVRLAGNSS